jgi:hypothetical protein
MDADATPLLGSHILLMVGSDLPVLRRGLVRSDGPSIADH